MRIDNRALVHREVARRAHLPGQEHVPLPRHRPGHPRPTPLRFEAKRDLVPERQSEFAKAEQRALASNGYVERQARDRGVEVLRLETNRSLTEAIALYRGSGYLEVAPFNDEPYAHHWFEKRLS